MKLLNVNIECAFGLFCILHNFINYFILFSIKILRTCDDRRHKMYISIRLYVFIFLEIKLYIIFCIENFLFLMSGLWHLIGIIMISAFCCWFVIMQFSTIPFYFIFPLDFYMNENRHRLFEKYYFFCMICHTL